MSRLPKASWLLGVVILAACSSSKPPAPVTYHRDIAPLVRAKCGGCHVEGGIAPFALQSYAQVSERRAAIREAVVTRHMPPWLPDRSCAEYQDDRSLTDEQLERLTRWIDAGAPEGEPAEDPGDSGDPAGGLSRVDLELTMPAEYTPRRFPDDYRCFILDWPRTDLQYVTGFNGKPGQRAEIHHLIAYLIRPEEVATIQALDDAEPGPGYTCFGGPGTNSGGTWLGAWAPGGMGQDFPEGTGLPVEPGSKIVLQVHYNATRSRAAPDRTAIQLKVDPAVEKPAFVLLWANPDWVLQRTMHIPAGQPDVVHRWEADATTFLARISRGIVRNGEPFTLYSAALHMHLLGTRGRLELLRGAGGAECLLDIPRWDFHWQNNYVLREPRVVRPGDSLALECHWDNSGPGAVDTNWGEGTRDEMCLGIFYITR